MASVDPERYAQEQIDQYGKHNYAFNYDCEPEFCGNLRRFERYRADIVSPPYQTAPICKNNFTKQYFDISRGSYIREDGEGNIEGNYSVKDGFLPQDKSGRAFRLNGSYLSIHAGDRYWSILEALSEPDPKLS